MTPNLEKLWNLTKIDWGLIEKEKNQYFDSIGLNLLKEPACWGYWCTPINTVSFASTGGDGVHFGFLCDVETPNDNCPIVMTLPSADTSNIIVGDNLLEFLSLGCRSGYFELEQLEYRPEEHIPFMDSGVYSTETTETEIELLKSIESCFQLSPWSNHRIRLEELEKKHLGLLKYSDEYYEITT